LAQTAQGTWTTGPLNHVCAAVNAAIYAIGGASPAGDTRSNVVEVFRL
jgi:hypothetical protein